MDPLEEKIAFVRRYYQDKGYRVHSGLQFGCELVLYADDPQHVHSDFCIHVVRDGEYGSILWRFHHLLGILFVGCSPLECTSSHAIVFIAASLIATHRRHVGLESHSNSSTIHARFAQDANFSQCCRGLSKWDCHGTRTSYGDGACPLSASNQDDRSRGAKKKAKNRSWRYFQR